MVVATLVAEGKVWVVWVVEEKEEETWAEAVKAREVAGVLMAVCREAPVGPSAKVVMAAAVPTLAGS